LRRSGGEFNLSSSQALAIDPGSNKLLGFTQTLTRSVAGGPVTTVTAPVNYTLDATAP
jgi:hypothetical protein